MSATSGHLYKVGIVTVSDSCFRGVKEDLSGQEIAKLLSEGDKFPHCDVLSTAVVPDEKDVIQGTIKTFADEDGVDLIFTIGGTGFSTRDVTPEATMAVCDKQAPGLAQSIVTLCAKDTNFALLSRAICGIRGSTIVYNLPGSLRGSKEVFLKVAPILPHAVDQLHGNKEAVEKCHLNLQKHHEEGDNLEVVYPSEPKRRPLEKDNVSQVHSGIVQRKSGVARIVATRCRSSPHETVSPEKALQMILNSCTMFTVETKPFNECHGHVCALDVKAKCALPPFRASVKDGYAVLCADGKGHRKVLNSMCPGDYPLAQHVPAGSCIRVSTGAPVPQNADAIVQVEDTEVSGTSLVGNEETEIIILKEPQPGLDIREEGSDIPVGVVVIKKGKTITAYDVAVMASVGVISVPVHTPPHVAVISTGDELKNPGENLDIGYIFDSNRSMICCLLNERNIKCTDVGIAKDNPDAILQKLDMAFNISDVVIITGSASMGEKDFVKDVLMTDFVSHLHFGRVLMKPGKPTAFFTVTHKLRTKYVFCLPGNPASAAVTFHLFVVPFLRKWEQQQDVRQLSITAKVGHNIALDSSRPEFHRALLKWEDHGKTPVAYSSGSQISSSLLSLCGASGFMMLPIASEETPVLKKGADVNFLMMNVFSSENHIGLDV